MRAMSAVAALILAGSAAAQDAEAGRRIAERWCAACHLVGSGQSQAADVAPSFRGVAEARAGQTAWLEGWITDPHPPMPNPGLSRGEIRDVVAYLASLSAD